MTPDSRPAEAIEKIRRSVDHPIVDGEGAFTNFSLPP